jgi:hypothetical protein
MHIFTFDEEARWPDLFGRAFERLGIAPVHVEPAAFDAAALPPSSVIVVSRDWDPEWRVALGAARRAGIPSVYVMDGVVEWSYVWNNQSYIRPEGTFQQPLFADYLCVLGRRPARYLASLGHGERIRIVGLPRLAPLAAAHAPVVSGGRRVLVATARTFGHNVEQKVAVRRALRDLRDWFAANPLVEPVWRIAQEVAAEIELVPQVQGSFAEALAECGACISFTSTALLEAMRAGLPVAQIDYRAVPILVETAWTIHSAEQIPAVVQELLHPPANKLAYQNFCMGEELEEGDASEKLAEVLREAAAIGRGPALEPAPKATVDGPLDYRLVHSEISAFSVGPQAVAQAELDATYRCLEQARAEIGKLRSDLKWAQSEFTKRGERVFELERDVATLSARLGELWQVQQQEGARFTEVAKWNGVLNVEKARLEAELVAAREALAPLSGTRLHDRLEGLADRIRGRGLKNVVVCGSGTVGTRIVEFLQAQQIEVSGITDRDRNHWGQRLGGVVIGSLDDMIAKGHTGFLIGSYGSVTEIRSDILRRFEGRVERPVIIPL